MNSDDNLFSGGEGYFGSQESLSLKCGNSFTRNRRSAFIVSSDRSRVTSIKNKLTTL